MFEFKISLNDDDFILFNQYHFLNSTLGKRTLLTLRFIIPFICFILVVIFFIAGSDLLFTIIEAILLTISSILWVSDSKKLILNSIKIRIKKLKKEGRLPYSNEGILKFDDESIHEITPSTENKTNYSLIEKIALTEKAIYIYFSSVQAYILPVTVFSEETEKLKFLEFINSKVDILQDTK
jgi:hypothetical protein